MIRKEKIEHIMYDFLQTDIEFVIEETNKVYRKGYVILFNIRDYFLFFSMRDDTKKSDFKNVEVPYPYAIRERENGEIELDYTMKTLANNNPLVYDKVRSMPIKHRLHNKTLIIRRVQ